MRLQLIICHKKRAPFFAFLYKTRANMQQDLPAQTGLYRYDEWMVQEINNRTLMEVNITLMEVNLVC